MIFGVPYWKYKIDPKQFSADILRDIEYNYSVDKDRNKWDKMTKNFLINSDMEINDTQTKSFEAFISRRAIKKEPMAYILNKKEFWSIKFKIDNPKKRINLLIFVRNE